MAELDDEDEDGDYFWIPYTVMDITIIHVRSLYVVIPTFITTQTRITVNNVNIPETLLHILIFLIPSIFISGPEPRNARA